MKSTPIRLVALLACGLTAAPAAAQSTEILDLSAVTRGDPWHVTGRTASMVEAKGKTALRISEGPGMGVAWLEGYEFKNGVIEVDLLGRSQRECWACGSARDQAATSPT